MFTYVNVEILRILYCSKIMILSTQLRRIIYLTQMHDHDVVTCGLILPHISRKSEPSK